MTLAVFIAAITILRPYYFSLTAKFVSWREGELPPHRDLETLFNLTRFLFSNSGPNFFVPDAIILFQVVCIGGEGFALSLSLPPSLSRPFVRWCARGLANSAFFSSKNLFRLWNWVFTTLWFNLLLGTSFLWGSAAVAPTSFVGASKSFESFQQLKPAYNVIWKERLKKAKH